MHQLTRTKYTAVNHKCFTKLSHSKLFTINKPILPHLFVVQTDKIKLCVKASVKCLSSKAS